MTVGTLGLAGLLMMPMPVFAGDVAFTTDTPLIVPVSGIDLTILSGSNADSVVLNSNTVTVTVSGSDTLRLQAPDNGRLENDKSLNPCTKVSGIVTLTVTSSNSPVVFTPSVTVCTTSSGGGSYIPSTTPVVTLTSPTGTFTAGTTVPISWTMGGTGVSGVDLAYSTNGGLTYSTIVTNIPITSYSWATPSALSGSVILRATGHDNGGISLTTSQTTLTAIASQVPTSLLSTDTELGITRDADGRRVAALTNQTGPSPITLLQESISDVHPGQFLRAYGFDTVYYVTSDYQRRPFWNSTTFFTWASSFNEIV